MGASESKNIANAVASVVNSVSESTNVSQTQLDQTRNVINLNKCDIYGNLDVNTEATLVAKNSQIVKAKQDTNLKNNIQQQMLQTATSTVGAMGIGYANASNAVNTMVNDTNTITNAMNTSAGQFSFVDNTFNCDNSTIRGNVNINFNSAKDFLSSQTVDNAQVSAIVNDVTQKVDQKATATIEGLGGLLIAIAMIIIAIGYTLTKPFTTGPLKFVLILIILFIVGSLMMTAYIKSLPPFFSKPSECIYGSNIGTGGSECINFQDSSITITDGAPLRYMYALTPDYTSGSGGDMLRMAIASASGQTPGNPMPNNGGYIMKTKTTLDGIISKYNDIANNIGIPNIPNPLYNPTGDPNKFFSLDKLYYKDNNDDNAGKCTPIIVQYSASGSTDTSKCPQYTKNTDKIEANKDNENIGLANVDLDSWRGYLNMSSPKSMGAHDNTLSRALFARFILADIIAPTGAVDMHIYIDPYELVRFRDNNGVVQTGLAKDYPQYTYKFVPNNIPSRLGLDGIVGGGKINGPVGVVNDAMYKFQGFMQKIGKWIALGFLLLTILFILFYTKKAPGQK